MLASSDGCDMCADASLPVNVHSSLVAATDVSFVRLSHNQAHSGYSLVILRDHVTDMTDLSPEQLTGFWRDVQRAGRAITRAARSRGPSRR